MFFCIRLISSSIVFLRFTHVVVYIRTSFPFYSHTVVYCMYLLHFVYPLMCSGAWVFSTISLLRKMLRTSICFSPCFQFFWVYPCWELLGHMEILYLWRITKLFIRAAPLDILTSNVCVPISPHSYENLFFFSLSF